MPEHALHAPDVGVDGFTVQDWLAWDGVGDLRVELIDGAFVVSPAPRALHQLVATNLLLRLEGVLPPRELVVTATGMGVVGDGMRPEQGLIPDVVVIDAAVALDDDELVVLSAADVVLAVEVLSPSSRRRDRLTKLEIYASMGIPHYWIVDPRGPVTISTMVLGGGAYRQGGSASGEEVLEVTQPFALTLVPQQLRGRVDPTKPRA